MHSSILLSFLSAGALTFALPHSNNGLNPCQTNLTLSANSSRPTLERRAHYGWVGSFKAIDCTGGAIMNTGAHTRPKAEAPGCYQFVTRSDNIGWDWGESPFTFQGIAFYHDTQCTNGASGAFKYEDGTENAHGANVCKSMKLNGGDKDVYRSFKID